MSLFRFDAVFRKGKIKYIAGIDEAGRGPLAGPLTAAAVILPVEWFLENLAESKRLSARRREKYFSFIIREALSYAVVSVCPRTIDRLNIFRATYMAMKRAVHCLSIVPDMLLIDGPHRLDIPLRQASVVHGDRQSAAIASASILAKVHRDRLMMKLDKKYPQYGFARHKGYPTKDHLKNLRLYGPSPVHRKSFSPVKNWKTL